MTGPATYHVVSLLIYFSYFSFSQSALGFSLRLSIIFLNCCNAVKKIIIIIKILKKYQLLQARVQCKVIILRFWETAHLPPLP